MKNLFSKTVQVNELAQISVIEDRDKGIIIQGLNYYYDPMKAAVQNMRLTTEAAEILKHLLQDWCIIKEKEKEEEAVSAMVESAEEEEKEFVPDKEQEKIIWETVKLQKELEVMKERLEKNREEMKLRKDQFNKCRIEQEELVTYTAELKVKLNCLAGR